MTTTMKKSTKELLAEYNELATQQGLKALASWKQKGDLLQARLDELRAKSTAQPANNETDEVPPVRFLQPNAEKAPKSKKTSKTSTGKTATKPRRGKAYKAKTSAGLADFEARCDKAIDQCIDGKVYTTVRELSEDLLRVVVYTNTEKRDVGLPYEAILDTVLATFGSSTTKACLRWYAVRLRRQPNEKIPMIRPRPPVVREA